MNAPHPIARAAAAAAFALAALPIEESGRWKIAHEAPVKRSAVALPESYQKASR